MLVSVILFSLLGALLNAVGAVLQRRATGQMAAKHLFRRDVFRRIARSRLWLGGVGLTVAGFFSQAVALRNGSLVVVEPLLTTDLIFLMLILHYSLGVRLGVREWLATGLLGGGLAGLVATTDPRNGIDHVAFGHWFVAFIVIGGLIVTGALAMRRTSNVALRAAIGGVTAGIHFSFTDVATKLVLNELHYGALHEFASWQLYALIIVGVTSALSLQSMYGAGPLAITQPALEITMATMGIVIGLTLFSDTVRHSTGALALEASFGLLLAIGIILLANSKRLQNPHLS